MEELGRMDAADNGIRQASKENGVQSVDRVLDIIEVLSLEQKGLGVSEIARRVDLHKSTAHRLISTLARRGYLNKTEEGNYRIGLKLIEAVSCYINSVELQAEARPFVAKITAELGMTSHLGVLDGDQVVYIEKMDVFTGMKMYSQIGLRVHAYCSSLGKCLLSAYSREKLDHVMQNCSFIKFTPNTIDSMESLHREITRVRTQGYAVDNEEFELGHRCIGAPIYDYRGDIVAAISASGPTNILTTERIPSIAAYLKDAAMAISKNLGYVI